MIDLFGIFRTLFGYLSPPQAKFFGFWSAPNHRERCFLQQNSMISMNFEAQKSKKNRLRRAKVTKSANDWK